jgi:hypothetical protein
MLKQMGKAGFLRDLTVGSDMIKDDQGGYRIRFILVQDYSKPVGETILFIRD